MDRSELEMRANALRQELKAWEKSFAAQHDGRKAGREDIKANASISMKYKEYNKLRDALSGRSAPQTPSKSRTTRRPEHDASMTPKAQQKTFTTTTPLGKRKRDSGVGYDEVDENENPRSPKLPDVIGPTPQRDGIVLGLFDLLPFAEHSPCKKRAVFADVTPNIPQTPSKNSAKAASETPSVSRFRGDRTPQSVGKRFVLDKFVTPQKRKAGEFGTPSSALKEFATPSFLRRDTALEMVPEEEPTPRPAPWKRRAMGRSLSSMIQSLKKQEDDRLDEEAEIMREMEMEAEGIFQPRKPRTSHTLVEDSQPPMALGPDRGAESEEEDKESAALPADALDRNGNPRKVWKKKGLKRQTRRVIMRPHFVKPLPPPVAQQEHDSSEEDKIAETQLMLEHDLASDASDFDDDGSDYASDYSHTPKKRRIAKQPAPATKTQAADKTSKGGIVAKAARKIKATAHANYRKLKIKSSKGSTGGGMRFGRRR